MQANEDIEVTWARRQEHIRGTLKLLRVIVATQQQHAQRVEQLYQLGGADVWMLWILQRTPGMRVVDLAKTMALHAKTVASMAGQLILRGLVTDRSDDENNVRVRFYLTKAGNRLLASAPQPVQGPINAALEQLDDKSLEKLSDGLRLVVSHLSDADEHAALQPLAQLLNVCGIAAETR